jgi:molybdopterin synthase catalytic subunit/molybdopterin synthase sulfur carrier subunit
VKLRLKLFAVAKQLAGADSLELELAEGATVADLRRKLVEQIPALGPLAPAMSFAVDQEYAGDKTVLSPGADVACIPPVSGG